MELTKNPDAMIGALSKIAGHSELPAPSQVQEMFLDHPRSSGLASLFATHPSIDDRIAALVRYAGGRAPPSLPPRGEPDEPADPSAFGRRTVSPADPSQVQPWGAPPSGPWDEPRS